MNFGISSSISISVKKWFFKKQQSGFTLIEMMVVISIIGILASISILGYQEYIKHMRDAQRVMDIATINNIILEFRYNAEKYPASLSELESVIRDRNNNTMMHDPLDTQVSCLTSSTDYTLDYCGYLYYSCDNQNGYIISAKFETKDYAKKYTQITNESSSYYHIGKCTFLDLPIPASIPSPENCRTKADCVIDSVCVGPPPKHCRPKNSQSIGSDCDSDDECISNKCKKKFCEA